MNSEASITERINKLNACVIIPTFNNCKTLQRVVDGVLQYTPNIIVVNDGSTDATSTILKLYSQINQITVPVNKGKGNALRLGFAKAIE